MKRFCLMAVLAAVTTCGVFIATQNHAYAESFYCAYGKAHGYFTAQYSSSGSPVCARQNILSQPALSNINTANGAPDFIAIVKASLQSASYDQRGSAAFIVDSMLGYRGAFHGAPAGGGTQNGIDYARNNWDTWVALVNSYQAANSDPASPYKVDWNYHASRQEFCGGGNNPDSGYDWNLGDAVYYYLPAWNTSGCDIYPDGNMLVRFSWPGGTFDIDKPCGNLSGALDKIPVAPVNHMPTGTITIFCKDPNTGLQNAHITFSDPDAATSAEFTVAGKLYGPYGAPSPKDIDLLLPPTTDAYNKQTVIISVKDTGPLGDGAYHAMPAVQTAAPCVNYGCNLQPPDPTPLDPNMGYSLTPGVTVSIGQSPNNPTISIVSIVKPGGGSYYSHGQIGAVNNSGTLQATFAGIPPTSSGGGGVGIYTVNWNLYTNGTLLKQCSGTFPVVYLPYANVYGGDVMVGASPSYSSGASTCSAPNTKAGAYSWNNHKAAGFPGAGAQYAVQTLSDITDFASALGSTNTPPHSLSFANNAVGVNDGQGLFGGNFGAITADCGFTSDLNEPGVTHINGNTTLNIGTLLAGSRKIYEVTNGNVYISSDIKYDTAGWTDPTQIPYFKLVVVGGNIYVGSGVKQLDGIYVAESTNASNGVIYTCAKGNGSAWTPSAADLTAGYYTTCNQTLTVNGAFVAAQVQLERTHGTVGKAQASDNISTSPSPDAEVFNYTPEVWLPRNAGAPNGGYDTITGLPPVL